MKGKSPEAALASFALKFRQITQLVEDLEREMASSTRAASREAEPPIATITRQSAALIETFARPAGKVGVSAARCARDGTASRMCSHSSKRRPMSRSRSAAG